MLVTSALALTSSTVGSARPKKAAKFEGSLISALRVSAPGVDGSAFAVKYWSRSVHNRPQSVTGIVFVPNGTAPAGGWPVISYGHPTDGMASQCAPSLSPSTDVPSVNGFLDRGWEVVATDYQGEGNPNLAPTTPGLQPHGVNLPEAHNIIDIVRAASGVPGADPSSNYVVWGYSQGGGAATFSLEVAASYAPGLHLRGVVATAPSVDLADAFYGAPTDSASPFTLMYVAGYHAAYGTKVRLSAALTQTGKALASHLGHECYGAIAQSIDQYQVDQVFKTTTLTPQFRLLLSANDPLNVRGVSPTPLLFVQGADDTTDPASGTALLSNHLCGLGQDVVLWMYPGLDHQSIVGSSSSDVTHWIADRFSGQPSPDTYQPTGVGGVQNSHCN